MFPNDGCEYSFFDPAMADPSRAEGYLTPEQRLNAIAKILATIALRMVRKEKEAEAGEHVGKSDAPVEKKTRTRKSNKTHQQEA